MVHARYGENNFVNLSDVNFLLTQLQIKWFKSTQVIIL